MRERADGVPRPVVRTPPPGSSRSMIVRGRGYRRIADGLRLRYVTDHPGGTLRRTARLRKIRPSRDRPRAPTPEIVDCARLLRCAPQQARGNGDRAPRARADDDLPRDCGRRQRFLSGPLDVEPGAAQGVGHRVVRRRCGSATAVGPAALLPGLAAAPVLSPAAALLAPALAAAALVASALRVRCRARAARHPSRPAPASPPRRARRPAAGSARSACAARRPRAPSPGRRRRT